jgi:cardiolipin synthase
MGLYRARDLLLVPSLISFVRLPLAAVFPFVVGQPWVALGVLVAAGLSDLADGWWARRYDQATATGAVVDPITDKIFVLTVVFTLMASGSLSFVSVLLLSTRELGELPLVVWLATSREARQKRKDHPKANLPGKAATALQFATVVAALFRWPWTGSLVGVTAAAGVLAAVVYWAREARRGLEPPAAPS